MAWNDSHKLNFLPVHLLVGCQPQTWKISNKPHPWVWRSFISFMPAPRTVMVRVPVENGEWKNRIKNGVEQAFASHFPSCLHP